jgi:methionyl-tRNA formyltransferase
MQVPAVRVAFAGTPEFARCALAAILAAGFEVPLVLTQPDRPAGRGHKVHASPVKELALEQGIPVHQPERLKDPATHGPLRAADVDVMVVAAYGLILPQAVLDMPRRGCINIHASLLPRWRGAAPIQRAIEAGDAETGVTIMRMEAGLDTGPMLLQEAIRIDDNNAARLHDRLAALGARLVVDALRNLDQLVATPQPDTGVTYAAKIDKAEAQLSFGLPAAELARRIRAFDPFPGAAAVLAGTPLKLWCAEAVDVAGGTPGSVLAADGAGIVVACGQGALRLLELQKPGGRRLPAGDFLRGTPVRPGDRFTD